MYQNAAPISEYFHMPRTKVVESGGPLLGTANKAAANRYLIAARLLTRSL